LAEQEQRVCALDGCENTFTPKRKTQIYCTVKHGEKAARLRRSEGQEERTCDLEGCDNRFSVSKASNKRFCSQDHGRKGRAKERASGTSGPSSHAERAARAQQGKATVEDRLRDDLDDARAALKQAQTVIKGYREQEKLEERVERMVSNALKESPYVPPLRKPKRPAKQARLSRGHEFLLDISDAHYGEVVDPEEALGIKYDTDIARRRIEYIRDATLKFKELAEAAYPVPKITVAVLGDMISGIIHEELAVTNEVTMVEQANDMAHILFNVFQDFSDAFDAVDMIIIPGNHPRINKKPNHKQKFNSWEFLMGKMVQGFVTVAGGNQKGGAFNVYVPKGLFYVHPIFGYRIAFAHGDGVKSNSFAGIPFYGLRNQREAIQALLSMTGNKRVDMYNLGHFHQYVDWGGECDVVINPSIKGGDEYGISTRLSAPEPQQLLMEWHPEHGRTSTHYLDLGHIA
jgi:hypothetical protein